MPNFIDTPKFLAVDFYCGAGSTTRGLLDAGGYVIAGIDKDERCHETYLHNNGNTTLDGDEPAFLALSKRTENRILAWSMVTDRLRSTLYIPTNYR